MYDTKSRELRWNATFSEYSAPLCEESYHYSECNCSSHGSRGTQLPSAHRTVQGPGVTVPGPAGLSVPIAGENRQQPMAGGRTEGDQRRHSPTAASLLLPPEMAHLASSGDGLVVTLDKESGEVLWAQNYGSPVVGIYLWHQDSLRRLPHLNLAMETLRYLTFQSQDIHVLKWSYQSVKDFAATKTQLLYVVPERVVGGGIRVPRAGPPLSVRDGR